MTPREKFIEDLIDRIPIAAGFILGVLVTLASQWVSR